jgi:hypothetical protein
VLAFTVVLNYFAYLALKFYSGQQPRASVSVTVLPLSQALRPILNGTAVVCGVPTGHPATGTPALHAGRVLWGSGAHSCGGYQQQTNPPQALCTSMLHPHLPSCFCGPCCPHFPASAAVQLPDEREILKRRLKAEERKQNTSVALTVLDSSRPGSRTGKASNGQAAWETGAGGANFEPVTLVVKNLR